MRLAHIVINLGSLVETLGPLSCYGWSLGQVATISACSERAHSATTRTAVAAARRNRRTGELATCHCVDRPRMATRLRRRRPPRPAGHHPRRHHPATYPSGHDRSTQTRTDRDRHRSRRPVRVVPDYRARALDVQRPLQQSQVAGG